MPLVICEECNCEFTISGSSQTVSCPNCGTVLTVDDDDEYEDVTYEGGGGFCFIATAAYGTPMTEEIDVLRKWRDNSLLTSAHGRAFVRVYYTISPPIARLISKSDTMRAITRTLLQPIVNLKRKNN